MIRSQRPEISNVYFITRSESPERHVHMQLTEVAGEIYASHRRTRTVKVCILTAVQIAPGYSSVTAEDVQCLAAVASLINKRPTFRVGVPLLTMKLVNSLTVQGMRAAFLKVGWDAERL